MHAAHLAAHLQARLQHEWLMQQQLRSATSHHAGLRARLAQAHRHCAHLRHTSASRSHARESVRHDWCALTAACMGSSSLHAPCSHSCSKGVQTCGLGIRTCMWHVQIQLLPRLWHMGKPGPPWAQAQAQVPTGSPPSAGLSGRPSAALFSASRQRTRHACKGGV
jgi:hypothetical protein